MVARKRRQTARERKPARAGTTDRRTRRLALGIAGLVILSVCTFAPARHFEFINYDDGEFIVDNPHVNSGISVENLQWAATHPYVATGGPVTWISHMLDIEIWGVHAGGHHLTSILLHTMNAVLLLLLLRTLTGSLSRSAVVAALFALHPLHVESVAWVAQRKDVLSTFLLLLTLLAYVRYVRSPGAVRYAGVLVLAALALMAKPVVVVLPILLLLLDVWPLERVSPGTILTRAGRRFVLEKIPLFVMSLVVIMLTVIEQQALGALPDLQQLPLSTRVANAFVACAAYLIKIVVPIGLVPYYPYRLPIDTLLLWASVAVLIALSVAAVATFKRAPYLTIGWAWYLVSLAPSLGLIQAGGHAMADRFTYLPLIGVFMAAVWGAWQVVERRTTARFAPLAAVVIVLVFAVTARAQTLHWRDSISLWEHTVRVSTRNARAHLNLGTALAARGQNARAIDHYAEALRLEPALAEAHYNLGTALERDQRLDDALLHYEDAVRLKPDYAKAHNNMANLLGLKGRRAQAIEHYEMAVALNPAYSHARVNLAVTLAEAGRLDEALKHMREALADQPGNAQWNYLAGMMLLRQGRSSEARRYLETAVTRDPAYEPAREALRQLTSGSD